MIVEAAGVLEPYGWLVMEIGAEQGVAVTAMATANAFADVRIRADYAGKPRVLLARLR